jgi:bifunctional pyridoxal-dependent enzyme with beta-cystathionase and maltose regulon repressor activities
MSIADTLFKVEEDIKEYLANDMITGWVGYSEGTPDLRAKVESLLRSMRELRIELDTPPDGHPWAREI